MDLIQKAGIRIEHWIEHNEEHAREYELFAQELKNAGKTESAQRILETAALTSQCSESLRRALKALA
jgi:ferric-dicitrate binding protein FerR (iron transport regulator)